MSHENERAVMIAGRFSSVATDEDKLATSDRFDPKNFDKLPARDVPVSSLSTGLHLRQGGMNAAHIQLLTDAAGSSVLPPILVQEDGCRVIDGLHRLESAKLRGDRTIKARFLDCTDSEALVLAMEANTTHGLPLSKADRISGAKRVLAAHPDWSDRAIAGITGLSAKTIASLGSRSAGGARLDSKRLGRDGRLRPVTAGEGRCRAAEYIRANPNAPLRQVARETDVSLGTVHDVRTRLRLGVSPERDGHRGPAARPAVHPASGAADTVTEMLGTSDTSLRRRENYTEPPATWAGVAANMAKDPTIRYTDGGKDFIRWMAVHASDPDGWRESVSAIPAHWRSVIAMIADSVGKEWSQFADHLKQSGSGAIGA